MAVTNPTVDVLLSEYLALLPAALTPTPARIFIQPGNEVAWDECCDGQAWVRLIGMTPVPTANKANGMPCGVVHWAVNLAAGVIRCVAVVDDRGKAPTAAQITDDGLVFAKDVDDLLQAIICAPRTTSIQSITPAGPTGGCAGHEISFLVRASACGCP